MKKCTDSLIYSFEKDDNLARIIFEHSKVTSLEDAINLYKLLGKNKSSLSKIIVIISSFGGEEEALSLAETLDFDPEIKALILAKIAITLNKFGKGENLESIVQYAVKSALNVKHERYKVLEEIAIQLAIAGLTDHAIQVLQSIDSPNRQKQTREKIERIMQGESLEFLENPQKTIIIEVIKVIPIGQ